MVKGVSIKFKSYFETVPKLLEITKLENLLKKHNLIVLKPALNPGKANTPVEFVESVLQFCLSHKNQDARVVIAEGSDGADTLDLFEKEGYKKLAEEYSIGLVDLNTADTEEIKDGEFLKFESIPYPKVLLEGLIISLPKLSEDSETEFSGALANMLGAFPARYFKGFFSKSKTRLRKEPIKYAIHDILRCKMPEVAVIDASEKGVVIMGNPLEIDKQAAKLLKGDWRSISHLRLVDESFAKDIEIEAKKQEAAQMPKTK